MKRFLLLCALLGSFFVAPPVFAQGILVPGDMNGDQEVDLFDTIRVINVVLGRTPVVNDADVNQDSDVDIRDVILTANIAVGNPAIAHSDPLRIPTAVGQVTIRGGNFDPDPANNVVRLNGLLATTRSVTIINNRPVALVVDVPAGTTTGGVMVTSAGIVALNSPILTVGGAAYSIDDVTVDEAGGTATLTIETNFGQSGPPNDFRITINTMDGSALSTGAGVGGNDFTSINNTQVTFTQGGPSTAQVMIPITDDMINEGTEQFTLLLSNPEMDNGSGFVADTSSTILDDTGVVTITDNDDSNISIDDVAVTEGNSGTTTLDFTVSIDNAATTDIRVMASTMDGSATTADNDYVMRSETVTIAAGQMSASFMVTVNSNMTFEADETVLVNLTTPAGGLGGNPLTMIADNQGIGTIRNDDAPPPASYTINDRTVNESAGTATLTIDSGLSQPVLTNYRITINTMDGSALSTGAGVGGNDFTAINSSTVTFTAGGSSTAQVMITINDDMINEATEQFNVVLSNPEVDLGSGFVSDTNSSITDDTAVVTITDNDDSNISINDVTVTEGFSGTTTATFTVSVDKAASADISVTATTADGTATTADNDYVANTGTVTITAGQTSASFAVTINGDPFFETDETVLVNLTNPTGGNPTTAIVDNQGIGTITNDDPQGANYTINDMTVNEDAGTATLTIDSGFGAGGPSTNFRITVNTMDSSALSTGAGVGGSDFTAINNQQVTFSQGGASTAQVMITINDDMINEATEQFNVVLSNPEVDLGGGFMSDPNSTITDGTGVVTITDNDDSNIIIDDPSVAEGNVGTVNLIYTVSVDKAASADITVMAATADGTATTADNDYVANTGTVTITAGQTSASFTVTVNGDTAQEADETVLVNLTTPAGGLGGNPTTAITDNQGVGRILNDEPSVDLANREGLATLAGDGTQGSANNANARQGQFNNPFGIAVDLLGSVYIADLANHLIRKVDAATGALTTIAGDGTPGFTDNADALQGQLNSPFGVAVDNAGNVYIGDQGNHRIRMIDAATGALVTIAGNGTAGFADNADPLLGQLASPSEVAVDAVGNVFIADQGNQRIRKIDRATGALITVAGNGVAGFADNADPLLGQLNNPTGIDVDNLGNVIIADRANHRVRRINRNTGALETIAGSGVIGFADNANALLGQFDSPTGVSVDNGGNVYVSDQTNNRIRKIEEQTGALVTVAGDGTAGFADNINPLQGQLNNPNSVAVDSSGNLYVSDLANQRIRTVKGAPIIVRDGLTTLAGDGNAAFADNADPLQSQLNNPIAAAVDDLGNVYIADQANHRIRKIDVATKAVTTIAGNGSPGFADNANPLLGQLNGPQGVAVDSAGNVFIGDLSNHRIRKIDAATGALVTIAGNGVAGFADNADPLLGQLNGPRGVTVDSVGNVYIADLSNHRIRKIDAATGALVTIAGNGTPGFADNANALLGQFNQPIDVAVDNAGNIYVGDVLNHRVRKIDVATGALETAAGDGNAGFADNANALLGQLNSPFGVSTDRFGNVYIADQLNHRLRKLDVISGALGTVAGTGVAGFADNINPLQGQFNNPAGVAVDRSGNIYIADQNNHRIRTVKAPPIVVREGLATLAGDGNQGLVDNADPLQGQFNNPFAVAVDVAGNVYVADKDNHVIRKIEVSTGALVTIAGDGNQGFADNVDPLQGQFAFPRGIAVDAAGNIYIADQDNHRIRMIDAATGALVTIAGDGTAGFADNADPLLGQFSSPRAIALDSAGNIFITDLGNRRVRKIDVVTGALGTIAGDGTPGFADNADPLQGQFNDPSELAVDDAGNVFIADFSNHRIRKIDAATGALITIAGTGVAGFADNPIATLGQFDGPSGLVLDGAGNLFVADLNNHRIRKIDAITGALITFAGTGVAGFADNAIPLLGQFNQPVGMAADRSGNLYVADLVNQRIRTLEAPLDVPAGVSTLADAADGISGPLGLDVDLAGRVFVANTGTNSILRIDRDGTVTTLADAGNGVSIPTGVAVDLLGNVYFANQGDDTVRRISPTGVVSTIASSANGVSTPTGVAVDLLGNVYVANVGNNSILLIATPTILPIVTVVANSINGIDDPAGIAVNLSGVIYVANRGDNTIKSVVGVGILVAVVTTFSDGGDGIDFPVGVDVDLLGRVYVANQGDQRIRRIGTLGGTATIIAGDGTIGSANNSNPLLAQFNLAGLAGLALDRNGNIYVPDAGNNAIRVIRAP